MAHYEGLAVAQLVAPRVGDVAVRGLAPHAQLLVDDAEPLVLCSALVRDRWLGGQVVRLLGG